MEALTDKIPTLSKDEQIKYLGQIKVLIKYIIRNL